MKRINYRIKARDNEIRFIKKHITDIIEVLMKRRNGGDDDDISSLMSGYLLLFLLYLYFSRYFTIFTFGGSKLS
jgi:hypothetical protein